MEISRWSSEANTTGSPFENGQPPPAGVAERALPAPLPGRMIFWTARSGGVRSLRLLDNRLISSRPPGGKHRVLHDNFPSFS